MSFGEVGKEGNVELEASIFRFIIQFHFCYWRWNLILLKMSVLVKFSDPHHYNVSGR